MFVAGIASVLSSLTISIGTVMLVIVDCYVFTGSLPHYPLGSGTSCRCCGFTLVATKLCEGVKQSR